MKEFKFPSGWLFTQPEFMDAMSQQVLSEHDEETVNRIDREQKETYAKPYFDAVKGVREVPRSEIPDLFTDALIGGFEKGTISQKINEKNEIVVFRVESLKP